MEQKKLDISIHLMLLFNCIPSFLTLNCLHFNTSNVTIQHIQVTGRIAENVISIHLMLLFNQTGRKQHRSSNIISIHLMLLFNVKGLSEITKKNNFNTSNVTIQRY